MNKMKFRVRSFETNEFVNLEDITITIDSTGIEIYTNEGAVLYNYEINQFSGIKDKNGVEAYEGDLVSYHFDDTIKGVIKYGEYKSPFDDEHASHIGFYVDFKEEKYKNTMRKDLGYWLSLSEICGNIYENS